MSSNEKEKDSLPKDHPRYESLKFRHKIIEGMKKLVVAEAGLIAHGRGEWFDYIIGEKTSSAAKKAIKAAVALLLLSDHPIISVNGNVAALMPEELVKLSNVLDAPLEINLFYRKEGRIEASWCKFYSERGKGDKWIKWRYSKKIHANLSWLRISCYKRWTKTRDKILLQFKRRWSNRTNRPVKHNSNNKRDEKSNKWR